MAEAKTSPRRINVALRRSKVLQMRVTGATYDEILAAFPNEYRTRSAVIQDVQRALMQAVSEPASELRALQAARLDMLWTRATQILDRAHVLVSGGQIVLGTDGNPLLDSGPVLAAIRELRKISESYRKLFGLDAPSVVQVMTDDAIDAEIRALTEELERSAAAQAGGAETASS